MTASVRPQPMIAVSDVEKSSAWYCELLGAASGHGGPEYEQLLVDGELILQLHKLEVGHHHGAIGDPEVALGNGVALWFEVDSLEAAAARARSAGFTIQTDLHHNPNAGHQELWLRDPDHFLVVLSDPAA
ncbi:glyoxalase/bleomycin resistance protein/dioxygenase superfamily protein [Kribbella voronezhensis]|uniref:Glyoxalase/bleomycin resistance protein/dioxygenase superfamily protein n=1 Tax=Kribbella voronezhensis TaxID=2512212 RepID=A0A4R7TF16_9ACTN|nr:VOC family protein [Kribbella voronezhensis]TDU90811.1 glyoxalase/bleomycin resistance protein/dioxygenase superfamily protein [Kribbella voronezhensis]